MHLIFLFRAIVLKILSFGFSKLLIFGAEISKLNIEDEGARKCIQMAGHPIALGGVGEVAVEHH